MNHSQEDEVATQLDLLIPQIIETESQIATEENGTRLVRTHRVSGQNRLIPTVSIDSASGSTHPNTRAQPAANPNMTRVVSQESPRTTQS